MQINSRVHFFDRKIRKSICLIMIVIAAMGLSGCQSKQEDSTIKDISRVLGIDVSSGQVISALDDHGGFHGDGTTVVEIQFSDTSCQEQVEESEIWCEFPLTDNLTALVYGLRSDEVSIGPILSRDDNPVIPEVANGYYCFVDRHSESTDPQDDSGVLNRYSFNFTIAIYDTDTNTLYYMELDT